MIDNFSQIKLSQSHQNFANIKLFIVISISLLEIDEELIVSFTDAALNGYVSKVNTILDAGAPFDIVDRIGNTVFNRAAEINRTDVTKLLLNRGADVNKRSGFDQHRALHSPAFYNNTDVIEVPLKHGSSTHLKDRHGRTPIDNARRRNNEVALRLLERH